MDCDSCTLSLEMVAIHRDMEKTIGKFSPAWWVTLIVSTRQEKHCDVHARKDCPSWTRCEGLSDFLANHISYTSRSVGLTRKPLNEAGAFLQMGFGTPKNEDQIKSKESGDTSVPFSVTANVIRVYRSLLCRLSG